jgi:alpha-ketoglutarate-dependent taurine dioxygenase
MQVKLREKMMADQDTINTQVIIEAHTQEIDGGLIRIQQPGSGTSLPLTITPGTPELNPIEWIASNRELIQTTLLRYGAILFRDFSVNAAEEFEQFIRAISGGLLTYMERSSPRTHISGNIYTSTDHPPDQSIFLHSENSYQRAWPLKLFFYCVTPATTGGETPIADTRKILQGIRPEVREQFLRKKVRYTRNFGSDLGLSWQTVFQTDDRAVVEKYCEAAGIEYEWRDHNRLRTRHVRDAVTTHPITKEPVWFNHAIFFHPHSLDPVVREALLLITYEDDLPYNSSYGDGSAIEQSALDHILSVYDQETVTFPWRAGDILMLDNMLVAHGRKPYTGPRKILVGMSELSDSSD